MAEMTRPSFRSAAVFHLAFPASLRAEQREREREGERERERKKEPNREREREREREGGRESEREKEQAQCRHLSQNLLLLCFLFPNIQVYRKNVSLLSISECQFCLWHDMSLSLNSATNRIS